MNPSLKQYIHRLKPNTATIASDRKALLQNTADTIHEKLNKSGKARLTFICTHNSRRSHLCQIWTAALAAYLDIEGIQTYSGGTETTAFNPRAVEAIRRAGFHIENPGGENPEYKVWYDENESALLCYSKKYDHPENPSKDFIAIMTCDEADEQCPVIPGAISRISLPYVDPKEADQTLHESRVYDERCRQIATEMLYMLQQVKQN